MLIKPREHLPGGAWLAAAVLSLTGALLSAQSGVGRTQWDGVFSEAQAERGRIGYEAHCAICHGPDLKGLPRVVSFPGQPPRTPALVGDEFWRNWEGLTLADLHERIRISMPQQAPGSLAARVVADIIAFLLKQDGCPSAGEDLPVHRDELALVSVGRRP